MGILKYYNINKQNMRITSLLLIIGAASSLRVETEKSDYPFSGDLAGSSVEATIIGEAAKKASEERGIKAAIDIYKETMKGKAGGKKEEEGTEEKKEEAKEGKKGKDGKKDGKDAKEEGKEEGKKE